MADETEPGLIELNGVTQSDFQSWKHHPVSKVFFRYLLDFAEQLRRSQLAKIEASDEALSPKEQGEYKGRINTVTELAEIEFGHLVAFYPLADEEDEDAA